MSSFLSGLFDTTDFPARWNCGIWSSAHGWTHIAADLATWSAYFTIPCVLVYFIRKRPDVPFPRVFWLFGAFIFACGTVHLIEAIIFWHPIYRISAVVKVATAIVSWATVIAILPIVPQALAIPGLRAINDKLEIEVRQRRDAEARLRSESDAIREVNADLRRFTDHAVGRELRMTELKREVNQLLEERNEPPRYDIDADEDTPAPAN